MDLPRDPGPLRQCRGLRLGHTSRPLLSEQPLGTAAGLRVEAQHVSGQGEPPAVAAVVSQTSLLTAANALSATEVAGSAAARGNLSMALMAHPHHRTMAGTRNPVLAPTVAIASSRASSAKDGSRRCSSVVRQKAHAASPQTRTPERPPRSSRRPDGRS